jgi:hypothetical protein
MFAQNTKIIKHAYLLRTNPSQQYFQWGLCFSKIFNSITKYYVYMIKNVLKYFAVNGDELRVKLRDL